MKVRVIEMREDGVAQPRELLTRALVHRGELEVVDTRENSFNRIIKLARLIERRVTSQKILYGAQILWVNKDRMCLTGFERKLRDGKMVDYAQSWICLIDQEDMDHGRDNEKLMPPRDDYRI